MKEQRLYTYLPADTTAETDGILSASLAPKGWEKYRERLGLPTAVSKEQVLAGLENREKGRSRAISVLTEPIDGHDVGHGSYSGLTMGEWL